MSIPNVAAVDYSDPPSDLKERALAFVRGEVVTFDYAEVSSVVKFLHSVRNGRAVWRVKPAHMSIPALLINNALAAGSNNLQLERFQFEEWHRWQNEHSFPFFGLGLLLVCVSEQKAIKSNRNH